MLFGLPNLDFLVLGASVAVHFTSHMNSHSKNTDLRQILCHETGVSEEGTRNLLVANCEIWM